MLKQKKDISDDDARSARRTLEQEALRTIHQVYTLSEWAGIEKREPETASRTFTWGIPGKISISVTDKDVKIVSHSPSVSIRREIIQNFCKLMLRGEK